MTREETIKALGCCAAGTIIACQNCPVRKYVPEFDEFNCCTYLAQYSLALIKILTEEGEAAHKRVIEVAKVMREIEQEEHPHGEWILEGNILFWCSRCRHIEATDTPYCANCGAKMDGRRKRNELLGS